MRYLPTLLVTLLNVTILRAQIPAILIDSLTEEPIIHANVRFEGTNKGTISNSEGIFYLETDLSVKRNIVITHIGYKSKNLYLSNIKDTVFLSPKTYKLNEVVVTDYSNILKKALNKFSKVKTDELFHRMYYKQYLKQNENYVDYLEAVIVENSNNENKEIYVESIRSKEDKIAKYVDFEYISIGNLIDYLNPSKLVGLKISNVNFIDKDIAEFIVEYKGKNLMLTVNTVNSNVIEVVYNSINDQLSKHYDKQQKVWTKGKIQTFQSYTYGQKIKVIYRYIGEKPVIKFFKIDYKGMLKSKDISLTYLSTQVLQSIEFTKSLDSTKRLKKLNKKKRNNLKSINSKKLTPFSWDKTNKIYPTKSELAFLDNLKWD